MRRILLITAIAVGAVSGCGGGGGNADTSTGAAAAPTVTLGPPQLAVLIAEGDATSEAVGRAYQAARGVPEANMIRVPLPPAAVGRDAISAADFSTVKSTVDALLATAAPGVQATLVTWSQPSRVQGATCSMGITSALAFGYDAAHCAVGCARTRASAYFASTSNAPWTDLRIRPSMMLGTTTLADAQALIARGLAAERSFSANNATGHAWLLRTSDADRSPRWPDFVQLAATSLAGITLHYVDNSAGAGSDVLSGQDAVMFYFTGLPVVPQLAGNRYRPGAVGDSFSSSGGVLPDGSGQTTVRQWLQAGLTGSYGTVEEPCNYTEKFPRATVLVGRYARGDALIEAYWKSVEQPGQGLFVGDPLARPWGR